MIIYKDWTTFKAIVDARKLSIQDFSDIQSTRYELYASDYPFMLSCHIPITIPESSDQLDYETNYKASANTVLDPRDENGRPLSRLAISTSGWTYAMLSLKVTTSTADGGSLKDGYGLELPYISYKMYNSNNEETTTASECVKTVIDLELPYDYEIIGGELKMRTPPTEELLYSVIAVPDIPAVYGGSKELVSSVDLYYITDSLKADGKVPKYLKYDAIYHTNKLRVIIKHSAGYVHSFIQILELFKL